MNHLLLLSGGWIAVIVVAVLVVLLICLAAWYISMHNKLQRLKNYIDEAWSTIDVSLKKRYDLIPNLVETVKGYTKHESDTMAAVTAARTRAINAVGDDKIDAEKVLSSSLKTFLSATHEAYPQLQANANFMDLQRQLKSIEDEIANYRRYYNGTVKELNTAIDMFFTGMVARQMRLEKRKYFELDSEEERKNVSVKF